MLSGLRAHSGYTPSLKRIEGLDPLSCWQRYSCNFFKIAKLNAADEAQGLG